MSTLDMAVVIKTSNLNAGFIDLIKNLHLVFTLINVNKN